MANVVAYNERGEKQIIPEHWLDNKHPGFRFTKNPPKNPVEPGETKSVKSAAAADKKES